MIWDALSNALISFAISVIELFPASPFVVLDSMASSEFYEWLQMVNWFIPINTFVGILETWLSGIAVYYVYQVVLRWVKVIE